MEISVGAILEGTIKSITKFGAFVTLPGGRSGLVHISEIAHSYVENVSDFLSIKKATPPPPRPQGFSRDRQNRSSDFRGGNRGGSAPQGGRSYNNGGGQSSGNRSGGRNYRHDARSAAPQSAGPADFEARLKQFMQASDSRLSDLKLNDRRSSRRGGHR